MSLTSKICTELDTIKHSSVCLKETAYQNARKTGREASGKGKFVPFLVMVYRAFVVIVAVITAQSSICEKAA